MVVLGAWCFDVIVNSCFDEDKYPVLIICNDTLNKQHTILFFSLLLRFWSIVGFVDLWMVVDQCLYH